MVYIAFVNPQILSEAGMPFGAVFVSGVLFVTLSLLPVRRWIIDAIPRGQKLAISAGIGFFLGVIALRNAGIIEGSPATLVTVGELTAPTAVLALIGFQRDRGAFGAAGPGRSDHRNGTAWRRFRPTRRPRCSRSTSARRCSWA